MLAFEKDAWANGWRRVAGIDEAGRGPLAGPVCAAAVIFNPDILFTGSFEPLNRINDSKRLSPKLREDIFVELTNCAAVELGIGLIEVDQIDRINILNATRAAMKLALAQLHPIPELVLVDGKPLKDLHPNPRFIVKGDSRSLSIAAASIIAKVTRDRIMTALDRDYPQYGFAAHKGYGTARHLEAIRLHGPCPHHRRTFRPIADLLMPTLDLP